MHRCVFSFDSASAVGESATGVSGSGGGCGGAGGHCSVSAAFLFLDLGAAAVPEADGRGDGACCAVGLEERTVPVAAAAAAAADAEEGAASTLGTGS